MDSTKDNLCTRCQKPILGPSRKDRFGNFYCQPCAQALIEAEKRQHERAAKAAAAKQQQPVTAIAAGVEPASADGTIPLTPEDESVHVKKRICDKCSRTINADAIVCAYCGHDPRKGLPENVARARASSPKCSNCGYDLVGLRTNICPECGTKNRLSHSRSLSMEQTSKETVRQAYRRPAIMLAIGLTGLLIVSLIAGRPVDTLFVLLGYIAQVPAGLGVYVLCCMIWIGFDMPLHLVAFRLAAIYAVVDLVGGVGVAIGVPGIVLSCIMLFTCVGLLMEELDLELQDAIIVAVLTAFGACVVAAILLVIAAQLGIKLMGM
jgi:hypothetical protein